MNGLALNNKRNGGRSGFTSMPRRGHSSRLARSILETRSHTLSVPVRATSWDLVITGLSNMEG